jgi:hypothetical protein
MLKTGMDEKDRVEITVAEVAFLTLGSWSEMANGYEIPNCYCDACDNSEAKLLVRDYYLSLKGHGVVANGGCKCCGEELSCTYGVLNPQLIQQVLTMTMNKPLE